MSYEVKLSIAGQIAQALSFMHQFPVIHLDVKPANILVSSIDLYPLYNQILYTYTMLCMQVEWDLYHVHV